MFQDNKYKNSLKTLFKSVEGQEVIKHWVNAFILSSAMTDKQDLTFYRLGQKEFVQGILLEVFTKEQQVNLMTDIDSL